MSDPIGAQGDVLSGLIHSFHTLAPGGFGLLLADRWRYLGDAVDDGRRMTAFVWPASSS